MANGSFKHVKSNLQYLGDTVTTEEVKSKINLIKKGSAPEGVRGIIKG